MEEQKRPVRDGILLALMIILSILFLIPIFIVLMNSFKGQFFISDAPFAFPTEETFSGITNYINGVEKTGFFSAFGYSLFITVFSVLLIILGTSMTSWSVSYTHLDVYKRQALCGKFLKLK